MRWLRGEMLLAGSVMCVAGCAPARSGLVLGDDPSTVVSSLSDAQAVDLCLAMIDHYDAVNGPNAMVRALCLGGAVTSEETELACSDAQASCLAEFVFDDATRRTTCEREITAARSGCSATIAEMETCVNDTTVLLTSLLEGSCADAPTVTTGTGTRYDGSSPPSCVALDDRCSALVLQSGRTP